jgi:hypothetical protein
MSSALYCNDRVDSYATPDTNKDMRLVTAVVATNFARPEQNDYVSFPHMLLSGTILHLKFIISGEVTKKEITVVVVILTY